LSKKKKRVYLVVPELE